MSGRSSNSSVTEKGSPTDGVQSVQTYDIPPKRQTAEVENSYDTPRSTRIWDNSRPSSVAVDDGVYDSPRSTKLAPQSDSGLYDVPRSSQLSLNRTSGSSTTSELLLEDRAKSLYLYDTPPSISVAVSSTSLYESPPPAISVSVQMAKSSESLKSAESSNSLKSELHFAVKTQDGGKDIYSKPSIKLKEKPTQLNIPPQLPPRNSPRNSLLEKPQSPMSPMSPDYMDIGDTTDAGPTKSNKEPKNCSHCKDPLDDNMKIINSNGDLFHAKCFVCAQCFQPFENGVFFEFENRKYCQHDFQVLFAPCCGKCSEFITGRVIRALSSNWHPQCLTCDHCDKPVADIGFSKVGGRAVCKECATKLRQQQGGMQCKKCHGTIEGDPLRWQGELYHPYHFNCTGCGVELTSSAREVRSRPGVTANKLNELYCLRCHDKMNIPICGACRRPIEERVVTALGKNWHVEHFACAKCEKPFFGHRHYERNGLAYCATHYHQLFGALCYHCDGVIHGDVFTALNKAWCAHHFACSACDLILGPKTKFFEVDLKPVCKKCYEKYPRSSRLKLKKYHEFELAREERAKSLKK